MKRLLTLVLIAALVVMALAFTQSAALARGGTPWNIFYYNNPSWAGYPVFTGSAPTLNFNWNGGSPAPNVPGTNWSMAATTTAYFTGGDYQFDALADDEVLLMVDNSIVIDTRGRNQVGKRQLRTWSLGTGNHTIQVNYNQFGGTSYLYVNWSYVKPGPQPQPQPNLQYPLPPASASSVVTQFGDYTPCIQKNIHQSNCFNANGQWDGPNLGSIQMEPQINIWGNCSPADKDVTWTVDPNTRPVKTGTWRCSKTLAGWFPS